MYNILTLNKIAACGTDIFDKAKYTVSDNAENPTAGTFSKDARYGNA